MSDLTDRPGIASIATAASDDHAGRFRALSSQEWTWRQAQFAGADEEDVQAQLADHLPRVDAATQSLRERCWTDVLNQLDAIPVDALHRDEQVSYLVYRNQVETLLADQRFRTWQMPFNSDTSFWANLGFTARRPLRNVADYRRYIGLLRDIPRYFDEQIANMRAGLARGFSVPRAALAGRDQAIAAVVDARGVDSLFYTPFRQMPANMPADEQARLRAAGLAAIHDAVAPAHARLLDFMRNVYMKQARDSLAAEAMPDGEAFYRAQVRKFTTLDMSPDAIHALGLREVARLHAEMEQAIRENDFRAEALGYRTVVFRTLSSVLAALFATVAGALLAIWLRYNGPDTSLSFEIMIDTLLIVVIAGMGTMYGAVIGSAFFVLAQSYLQDLMRWISEGFAALPLAAALFSPDRWLLWLGVLFVLSVYYFPSGVVGRLRARALARGLR